MILAGVNEWYTVQRCTQYNKRSWLYVLVISLPTVPLQSIVHELDECFILGKGTVWRGITDIILYHMLRT